MDKRDFITFLRAHAKEYKKKCLTDEFENGKFWACIEMIQELEEEIEAENNNHD